MNDVKELLEQARRQAPPTSADLDRIRNLRERKQRNGRIAATAVGLTLTLVIVATLFALPGHRTKTASPGSIPPGLGIGPGRFWFRRTTFYGINQCTADLGACSVFVEGGETPYPYVGVQTENLWWSPDGSAREESRILEPLFFSDQERTDYIDRYGPLQAGSLQASDYAPGEYAARYPDDDPAHGGLSMDPTELAAQLQDRLKAEAPSPVIHPTPEVTGQGPETPAFVRVLQALMPNADPALQAALFEVASTWEGMHTVDGVTDPVGRNAIELRINTENQLHEWFFDPSTEQLLANVEFDQHGKAYSAVFVESAGIVGSIGDHPQSGEVLVPAPVTNANPLVDPRG